MTFPCHFFIFAVVGGCHFPPFVCVLSWQCTLLHLWVLLFWVLCFSTLFAVFCSSVSSFFSSSKSFQIRGFLFLLFFFAIILSCRAVYLCSDQSACLCTVVCVCVCFLFVFIFHQLIFAALAHQITLPLTFCTEIFPSSPTRTHLFPALPSDISLHAFCLFLVFLAEASIFFLYVYQSHINHCYHVLPCVLVTYSILMCASCSIFFWFVSGGK